MRPRSRLRRSAVADDAIVVLAQSQAANSFGVSVRVGTQFPLVPPIGTVFLAWARRDLVGRWLANMDTTAGAAQRQRTLDALAIVRERGFAVALATAPTSNGGPGRLEVDDYLLFDLDERQRLPIGHIAAPVFDPEGSVQLALTVAGFHDASSENIPCSPSGSLRPRNRSPSARGGARPAYRPDHQEERQLMVTHSENELLTRVEGDAPMGRLLREHYWIPALVSSQLVADGAPIRSRLLGRNYVAFRATDGRIGYFDEACPHRGTSLALARNEECGLRCIFHGWKIEHCRGRSCGTSPTHSPESGGVRRAKVPVARRHVRGGGMVWVWLGSGGRAAVPAPAVHDPRRPVTCG